MKFRLICFGYHLLVSFFIAILCVGLVFWLWYPSPLDKALGVVNIFLLLLCIDVIAGPILTFIVAKQGKKTLKADLFIIGLIQLSALAYGLYTVAKGRPVWIVYDIDRFELVQAYEAELTSSPNDFRLVLTGPIWGAVKNSVPKSIGKENAYYRAEFLQFYDPKIAAGVGVSARPLAVLKRFNDPDKVKLILSKYPEADSFIPMAAKQKSLSVLIRRDSGKPIAIVDLSPW